VRALRRQDAPASEAAAALSRPASPESASKVAASRARSRSEARASRGSALRGRERARVAAGSAIVYRARRNGSDRPVALKLLSLDDDPIASRRFVREIRALAKVQHPNVVKIYDCDQADGKLFYAMELLEGAPLADVIDKGGPVAPPVVARIARDCLAASARSTPAGSCTAT